jgi:ketose-bisphosphate aldolase
MASPLIVQISQKELDRYVVTPEEFADEFYANLQVLNIEVPVVLHLDHTKDFRVIEQAIEAGFTSVMIDASEMPLDENIRITREVTELAHHHGVSVEAELGKIGTTDFVETDEDEELYTDPVEAERFVRETGIDALAASIGTAHGVYQTREPKVDLQRLQAIRHLTDVHIVLHGGSGVPAYMIHNAIQIQGGGISKVNIATDLEVAVLAALNRSERMTNADCKALSEREFTPAAVAVRDLVAEKIANFLGSKDHASDYFDSSQWAVRS